MSEPVYVNNEYLSNECGEEFRERKLYSLGLAHGREDCPRCGESCWDYRTPPNPLVRIFEKLSRGRRNDPSFVPMVKLRESGKQV